MQLSLGDHPVEKMRTRVTKEAARNAHAPPTRSEQLESLFCSHKLEIWGCDTARSVPVWRLVSHTRTLGIATVSELILCIVRRSEDVISEEINNSTHDTNQHICVHAPFMRLVDNEDRILGEHKV